MLKTIQAARAVACVSVLISHAAAVVMLQKYWGTPILGGWLHIGRSGVDLFFVISGFIIFSVHHQDIGRPSRIGRFAYNRFTRIYPFYWIIAVSLIILTAYGLFGVPRVYRPIELVDFLGLVRIVPTQSPVAVAWSLYFELMFYFVFAILILNRLVGLAVMAAALALVCVGIGYEAAGVRLVNDYILSNYALLFEFVGGYWAWRSQQWLTAAMGRKLLAAGLAVLVIAIAVVDVMEVYERFLFSRLLYGLAYTLIVAGVVAIERHRPVAVPPFLVKLGDASYAIYLVHFPTISLFAKALMRTPVIKTLPYLDFVLLSLISLGVGLLAHELCEKPLMKKLRRRPVARSVAMA